MLEIYQCWKTMTETTSLNDDLTGYAKNGISRPVNERFSNLRILKIQNPICWQNHLSGGHNPRYGGITDFVPKSCVAHPFEVPGNIFLMIRIL
jgi:hypothetical protein